MSEARLEEMLLCGPILMDGATGHELFRHGMPSGVCPEDWVLDNPGVVRDLQSRYVAAGSRIILTPSFGANRRKLAEYGLDRDVLGLNRRLAEISRSVAGDALVAGDVSMTGDFVRPTGSLDFEEAVKIYAEQIRGLVQGGIDLVFIETMVDIAEARAALIAARESCELPIICSMTFECDGTTVTGVHPASALITLQSLGAFAVGCNCSTGPADMLGIISEMAPYAEVPLVAKPNAGMPRINAAGDPEYSLNPAEFAREYALLLGAGVEIIGGCCGTHPGHIEALAELDHSLRGRPPRENGSQRGMVCSPRKRVDLGEDRLRIIGERINPSGNGRLSASLRRGEMQVVREYAIEQEEDGADLLDVNVGSPSSEELELVDAVVEELAAREVPVAIDSADPAVIRRALRRYPGRALVNSISFESEKMDVLMDICREYGAPFIALPIGDEGIPETVEDRLQLLKAIRERAVEEYRIDRDDIVCDCLMLPLSTDPVAATRALRLVELVRGELRAPAVLGLSNLSFGLSNRSALNATFLAMAAERGLNLVIANVCDEAISDTRAGVEALLGRDDGLVEYIGVGQSADATVHGDFGDPLDGIRCSILRGLHEDVAGLVRDAVAEKDPAFVLDSCIFPAIREVGSRYEEGRIYLPQLIASAQTVERAVAALQDLHPEHRFAGRATVVMATVRGDIHDIGKNLVAMMLRNHGFKVVDLGRDVPAEVILESLRREGADLVGLSALMTTTAAEMRRVVSLIAEGDVACRVLVGGAVITAEFAREIGAAAHVRLGRQAR
ncbi:MAG: homocysteine S-methyltransferase family protein, partial [Clostridia bacterium]